MSDLAGNPEDRFSDVAAQIRQKQHQCNQMSTTWENQQCGFWPGLTQTRLCSYWRWLEAWNFGFRKYRDCSIRVAKSKALKSFAITAKLICVFVFAVCKTLVFSCRGSNLLWQKIKIIYHKNIIWDTTWENLSYGFWQVLTPTGLHRHSRLL